MSYTKREKGGMKFSSRRRIFCPAADLLSSYGVRRKRHCHPGNVILKHCYLSSTMPSILQTALFIESLVNVPFIISLIFYPESTLRPAITPNPLSPAAELNQTATLIARCFGVLILALTPQLVSALPDSKDCVGKRKQIYLTLGYGEGGLIALFLWEAFRKRSSEELGGFTKTAALLCVGVLTPCLAWRVFVFRWKGQWFRPRGGLGGERKIQ